jgi:dolichyl-diphosphooligosaccharide--protein glycosyltransferase
MGEEEKMSEENEEEISINLGKITGFFRKKKENKKEEHKKEISVEKKKTRREEEKNKEEEKTLPEKTGGEEEISKEKGKREVEAEKEAAKEEADEQVSIDFGKIKKFFGSDKKEKKEQAKPEEAIEEEKEELSVDFKRVGKNIKSWFKAQKKEGKAPEGLGDTYAFFSRHKKIILPLVLITFVAALSIYLRIMPMFLPFTDEWADNSVRTLVQSDINAWVSQSYPNLPERNRNDLVSKEYSAAMRSGVYQFKTGQYAGQLININDQKRQFSESFKTFYKFDEGADKGKPYMPDIDPYYWYRYASNIIERGHPGDEVRNDEPWDNHQLAPNGRPVARTDWFHPYFLAYFYQVTHPFTGASLLRTMMYYPIIISALTVIIIFFIARRAAGNIGGVFAASMAAVSQAFASRTLFGHADSDAWVIFFPVVIAWLFIEAFESKKLKKQIVLSALSGFFVGVYSFSWGGWWYIFDFVLATIAIYAAYYFIIHYREIRNFKQIKKSALKDTAIIALSFLIFSGIFVTMFNDFNTFVTAPVAFLGFARFKDPVLPTLWPNVLTTVAELNEGTIDQIIANIGGTFLAWTALMGIILTMFRKTVRDLAFVLGSGAWWVIVVGSLRNIKPIIFLMLLATPVAIRILLALWEKDRKIDLKYAVLLTLWFIGAMYAGTKGIRFTLVLIPAFSTGFGVAIGVVFNYLLKALSKEFQINKIIIGMVLLLLLSMPFFAPRNVAAETLFIAKHDVPIINDAWYNALASIKNDSKPNAIISSWWDFGHHFKALADRPVTFDGTTQDMPQAHWIGKVLLTNDEDQAAGIMRMLDCSGNNAFNEFYKANNDTHRSINIIYDIIMLEKQEAKAALTSKYGLSSEQAEKVLSYTHCEPPEAYFIASQDMINKAGVWSHFGSWDFEKAAIVHDVKRAGMNVNDGVKYMQQKFNYTEEKARNTYYELQTLTTNAAENQWVAPWLGYQSGAIDCRVEENRIVCPQNINAQGRNVLIHIIIDLADMRNVTIPETSNMKPNSLIYATQTGIKEEVFENRTTGFSVILVPQGRNSYYSVLAGPEIASSMFTRMFFFEGHGLRHFTLLTHQRSITQQNIYVYKIDWKGHAPNVMPAMAPKEQVGVGDKVKVHYIGYFENGEVFDTSIKQPGVMKDLPLEGMEQVHEPLEFTAGAGQLIAGFDEAVIGMKKNTEKIVEIPPEKGYGTDPSAVPEELRNLVNKTLYFKIRVYDIK